MSHIIKLYNVYAVPILTGLCASTSLTMLGYIMADSERCNFKIQQREYELRIKDLENQNKHLQRQLDQSTKN